MPEVTDSSPADADRRYEGALAALASAWEARDEAAFFGHLDRLAVTREQALRRDIGALTRDIQDALEEFCAAARVEDLTRKEVPNARVSLEHVLKLTEDAAHNTMDLVERSCVPADGTRIEAERIAAALDGLEGLTTEIDDTTTLALVREFVDTARAGAEQIRRNLTEVLLAQGYQDLSGQIIRSVMKLIDEIHDALDGLITLSRGERTTFRRCDRTSGAHGPAVPGTVTSEVVTDQDDIDNLLSRLDL